MSILSDMNNTTNNRVYRVGLSWYVRTANVAKWINGRAVRNDLWFPSKREALRYLKTGTAP